MFQLYNPNPLGKNAHDCVIRAVCKVTGMTWDDAYLDLMAVGFDVKEMMSVNTTWAEWLRRLGFRRTAIPDECPDCYKVKDFAQDHPEGAFIVWTDGHVVAVVDGDYFDTTDSGDDTALYYWRREK